MSGIGNHARFNLFHAFKAAHTPSDVWAALRFHKSQYGEDFMGYLDGSIFNPSGSNTPDWEQSWPEVRDSMPDDIRDWNP